jgi:hypothetical protein
MVASTAIFLFGWGGGVIARILPVPAVGGRSSMASGANRFAIAGANIAQLARSCKFKN